MSIDLTGQKFGKLTALEPTSDRINNSVVWKCRCDCGNICFASRTNLTRGQKKSCGCLRKLEDLSGQRFGKLTVLYKIENAKPHVMYHCRCDCGNECDVRATQLRNGFQTSCGREESAMTLDIKGKRFGMLIALEDTGKRERGYRVWKCRCDCGNEINLSTFYLTTGRQLSCGCTPICRDEDLTGRRFGKLTVLAEVDGSRRWHCRCDCGNEVDFYGNELLGNRRISCGCLKKKRTTSSPSGHAGIRAHQTTTGLHYQAYFNHRCLGTYETLEEALEAQKKAEES